MIRNIFLYGNLAEIYTKEPIEKDVNSIYELVSALNSELPDFRAYISEFKEQMIILSDKDKENPRSIENEIAAANFDLDAKEIHIIPNHNGAGIEIATVIFAGASKFTISVMGFIINTLISMAISAVIQSLSPTEKTNAREHDVQQQPSFLYNGAQNVTEQGFPVPVIYGIHMTGSIVASAGTYIEQLLTQPSQSAPPPNGGGSAQPASPVAMPWQWGGGAV